MKIPPLSHIFRLAGFINLGAIWSKTEEMSTEVDETFNSLSIDMVEVEDKKARGTGLPLFPRGQTLDNWTTVELSVIFKLSNE